MDKAGTRSRRHEAGNRAPHAHAAPNTSTKRYSKRREHHVMTDSSRHTPSTGKAARQTPPSSSKADALRRLSWLKKGVTLTSVLGFGGLGGVIALQSAGTYTTTTATAARASVTRATATSSATVTPLSSATPVPSTTSQPSATPAPSVTPASAPRRKVAAITPHRAAIPPTATKVPPTATTIPPTATAIPSTAIPSATTAPQTNTSSQGQGGNGIGTTTSPQPPVAASGAS